MAASMSAVGDVAADQDQVRVGQRVEGGLVAGNQALEGTGGDADELRLAVGGLELGKVDVGGVGIGAAGLYAAQMVDQQTLFAGGARSGPHDEGVGHGWQFRPFLRLVRATLSRPPPTLALKPL